MQTATSERLYAATEKEFTRMAMELKKVAW
jgi:hypothetical protein